LFVLGKLVELNFVLYYSPQGEKEAVAAKVSNENEPLDLEPNVDTS
jgi:hypothetical protein